MMRWRGLATIFLLVFSGWCPGGEAYVIESDTPHGEVIRAQLSDDGGIVLADARTEPRDPRTWVIFSSDGRELDTLEDGSRRIGKVYSPDSSQIFGTSFLLDEPTNDVVLWARNDSNPVYEAETLASDELDGLGPPGPLSFFYYFSIEDGTPDGGVMVGTRALGLNFSVAALFADGAVTLPHIFPAGAQSRFHEISNDGTTLLGWYFVEDKVGDDHIDETFLWNRDTGSIAVLRDATGGTSFSASLLSDDGKVVVGSTEDEVLVWKNGERPVALQSPVEGAEVLAPRGISADASRIAGVTGSQSTEFVGFIYSEQRGMEVLEDVLLNECGLDSFVGDWNVHAVEDISNDGQVLLAEVRSTVDSRRAYARIEFGVEGDVDGNNVVEFADFLNLSEAFGVVGDGLAADFDGNGTVGFEDFLTLSANFGDRCYALGNGEAVAVPEPTNTLPTWIFVGCLITFYRQRRYQGSPKT